MLDRPALGSATKNMRRSSYERFAPGALIGLFRKGSLRPVNPSVQAQVRPVQVIGAIGQGLGIEPFHTLVCHAVAIGIGQLPDAGRRRYIHRAIVPEHPFGKHHLVSEHGAPVVAPVAIDVFQAEDAVGALRELLLHRVIRSRRLGHIQAALVVHVHDHRALDERRPGCQFDLETFRNCDLIDGIRSSSATADQGRGS